MNSEETPYNCKTTFDIYNLFLKCMIMVDQEVLTQSVLQILSSFKHNIGESSDPKFRLSSSSKRQIRLPVSDLGCDFLVGMTRRVEPTPLKSITVIVTVNMDVPQNITHILSV